jgi:hypothetical protein
MGLTTDTVPSSSETTVNETPTLGSIASSSPAGRAVFKVLEARERFRRVTDLNRLHAYIVENVNGSIEEDAFLNVFRSLESMGAGRLIIGRKNRPNRFYWSYNLRDAAQAAKDNKTIADLQPLPPKRRGRKKQMKKRRKVSHKAAERKINKAIQAGRITTPPVAPQPQALGPVINISVQLPPGAKPEEVKAFLDLAKGMQG